MEPNSAKRHVWLAMNCSNLRGYDGRFEKIKKWKKKGKNNKYKKVRKSWTTKRHEIYEGNGLTFLCPLYKFYLFLINTPIMVMNPLKKVTSGKLEGFFNYQSMVLLSKYYGHYSSSRYCDWSQISGLYRNSPWDWTQISIKLGTSMLYTKS